MYFYGKTDIGKKRATNQDTFRTMWLYDNCCLCVICDGMGGANGGNIASEIAVNLFSEGVAKRLSEYPSRDGMLLIDPIEQRERIGALLQASADRANEAVYQRAKEDQALSGMGTTLVCALVIDRVLFALNVGDSRMYQVSDRSIRQLTKDHSYLQYLIDSGQLKKDDAQGAMSIRNIITRSLGTEPDVKGDLYLLRLKGEGCILLCSDGLSGYVSDEVMFDTINAPCLICEEIDHEFELEDKTLRLIDLANEAGGGDNITVVLLKYTEQKEGGDGE